MRLTTKGRYAVTAMLDIAIYGDQGPVSVQDIAERQMISSAYLEQIVGRLKRIGLLNCVLVTASVNWFQRLIAHCAVLTKANMVTGK